MENRLYPIDEKVFYDRVSIRFENIQDGFSKYESVSLSGKDENIIKFILELYKYNGFESSFVDFYYSRLNDESKRKVKSILDTNELQLIKGYEKYMNNNHIYFQLDKEFLSLIVKLSLKEMLFSTFYFAKSNFTIWGNYNNNFPCFYINEEDYIIYKQIADKCEVELI